MVDKKLRTFSSRKKITILLVVVAGIFIVFSGGYQLAVYQSNKGSTFSLPHFNIGVPGTTITHCGGSFCCANQDEVCPAKPVIYLYPTRTTIVRVKVDYAAGFSRSNPLYNLRTGWQVLAQPNGQLTDITTGKTYPYLFWEGNPEAMHFDMTEGSVVRGSDVATFLQKQLSTIGLNPNEGNAFMSYWVPKLQDNPYNLIHFAGSEYTNNVTLSITPKPQSVLRVFMVYQALKTPISATPQSFQVFHRQGFTAVEWGGTELN